MQRTSSESVAIVRGRHQRGSRHRRLVRLVQRLRSLLRARSLGPAFPAHRNRSRRHVRHRGGVGEFVGEGSRAPRVRANGQGAEEGGELGTEDVVLCRGNFSFYRASLSLLRLLPIWLPFSSVQRRYADILSLFFVEFFLRLGSSGTAVILRLCRHWYYSRRSLSPRLFYFN